MRFCFCYAHHTLKLSIEQKRLFSIAQHIIPCARLNFTKIFSSYNVSLESKHFWYFLMHEVEYSPCSFIWAWYSFCSHIKSSRSMSFSHASSKRKNDKWLVEAKNFVTVEIYSRRDVFHRELKKENMETSCESSMLKILRVSDNSTGVTASLWRVSWPSSICESQ